MPFLIIALALACLSGCAYWHEWFPPEEALPEAGTRYEVRTRKPYDDVLAELHIAITEQNFRITGHNKIGSVIRKREGIKFPDFDAVQFCNLTLARKMLEISPAAVRYMPCNITLHKEGDVTVVGTNLLPENTGKPDLDSFFRTLNKDLRKVVDFAGSD